MPPQLTGVDNCLWFSVFRPRTANLRDRSNLRRRKIWIEIHPKSATDFRQRTPVETAIGTQLSPNWMNNVGPFSTGLREERRCGRFSRAAAIDRATGLVCCSISPIGTFGTASIRSGFFGRSQCRTPVVGERGRCDHQLFRSPERGLRAPAAAPFNSMQASRATTHH